MPLYDYQCELCGYTTEHFTHPDEQELECEMCGGVAKRLFSSGHANPRYDSEHPGWLRDTLEVVDKEGGRHCQEFLHNPSRENYRDWMRGEGIRPMERGEEKMHRPDWDAHTKEMTEKVWDAHQKRHRLVLHDRG